MRWIKFKGQTHSFGAPPGVSSSDCGSLPLKLSDERFSDGMGLSFRSYWKPSTEEIRMLQAGYSIELLIRGDGHPPVMLSVENVQEIHDA